MIGGVAALPRKRRSRGSVRPARRPAGAGGSGVVPRARLPARGDADARDVRARSRSSLSTGARRSCRGSARRSRRRSSRSSTQGEIEALAKKRSGVPPEVVLFMRLPGPRAEDGGAHLEGARRHDARRAEGRRGGRAAARTLPGLGAKSEEKILKALAFQAENPDAGRRLLGVGLPAVQAVVSVLREHPAAVHVSEAGSVRRRKETFRDLDIIATATDPAELTRVLHRSCRGSSRSSRTATRRRRLLSNEGLRFDLRVVPPESFGNLLQHFTGSKEHNVAMREDAVRRGLSISEYGVTTVETGDVFTSEDEDARLRVPRLSADPAGAARERAASSRRRGAASCPTSSSLAICAATCTRTRTGRPTARTRSRRWSPAALARGYEYYAITDHSHYLREGRLARSSRRSRRCARSTRSCASSRASRRTSARTARSTCPRTSCAALDWVVASVHNAPQNRPTERVLEAMDNPYVDCIGHLTGRRIGTRGPRDVDVARVIEKALEVGCFLEINGQPDRLDLQRRARARGEGGGAEARRQLRCAPDSVRRATSSSGSGRRGAAG